jgi:hypothetical protein
MAANVGGMGSNCNEALVPVVIIMYEMCGAMAARIPK